MTTETTTDIRQSYIPAIREHLTLCGFVYEDGEWQHQVAADYMMASPMREMAVGSVPADGNLPLEQRLQNLDKTFQEYLFALIDQKGLSDVAVYKAAGMDRKHFSKIRSNRDYRPKKRTALALAIALKINLDETEDLLRRAGYALSDSDAGDVIIGYCIEQGVTDLGLINELLHEFGQEILGL